MQACIQRPPKTAWHHLLVSPKLLQGIDLMAIAVFRCNAVHCRPGSRTQVQLSRCASFNLLHVRSNPPARPLIACYWCRMGFAGQNVGFGLRVGEQGIEAGQDPLPIRVIAGFLGSFLPIVLT